MSDSSVSQVQESEGLKITLPNKRHHMEHVQNKGEGFEEGVQVNKLIYFRDGAWRRWEADGWWLSYPQMFNTYILINRFNGCLVGANDTCLQSQAHLYPLVLYSSRLHSILLSVDGCHTAYMQKTHSTHTQTYTNKSLLLGGNTISHQLHSFIMTAQSQMIQIYCTPRGGIALHRPK